MTNEAWAALQTEIGSWSDQAFPQATLHSIKKHFEKESKEFVESGDPSEIADCVLLLMHYAHRQGYNILEEVRKKHEINKTRVWGKPDADGVVEHVRD